MTADSVENDERIIVITREFDAPRDLVWRMFTEAEHVARWWGPKGFTTRVELHEMAPGGKTRYVMTGPDGTEYPVEGVFREIDAPSRYVATDEFGEGFEGETIDGIVLTAAFEDLGGRTRVTLYLAHPSAEDRKKHEDMGVSAGWQSSFDCLDEYLATL